MNPSHQRILAATVAGISGSGVAIAWALILFIAHEVQTGDVEHLAWLPLTGSLVLGGLFKLWLLATISMIVALALPLALIARVGLAVIVLAIAAWLNGEFDLHPVFDPMTGAAASLVSPQGRWLALFGAVVTIGMMLYFEKKVLRHNA